MLHIRYQVLVERVLVVVQNDPILLANPLQSSRCTFSWGSFLSLFAFKEGMMDSQISALGGWPTVSDPFSSVPWAIILSEHASAGVV